MDTDIVTGTQAAGPDGSWPETMVVEATAAAHRRARLHNRGWLIRRALLGADVIGLVFAFVISALLVRTPIAKLLGETAVFGLTLPVWVLLGKLHDLYDRDETMIDNSTVDDIAPVFHLVTLCTWVATLVIFLAGELNEGRVFRVVSFWALAILLVLFARWGARAQARKQPRFVQNAIIFGAGRVGQDIAHKLIRHPEFGINIVGVVDSEPMERRDDLGDIVLLGTPDNLPELVNLYNVERAIIAFSNDGHEVSLALIRTLHDLNLHVDIVPRLFDLTSERVQMHSVQGIPLVGLARMRLSRSSRLLKRGLDLILGGVALVVLSPLLLATAIWIKVDSRGPALFKQTRIGRGGVEFRVIKFRTMYTDAEHRKHEFTHLNRHARSGGDTRMFKIENDPRVTRAGRFLRRYFFDELPQLMNVLKGEMSLIGPRPLVPDEARHATDWGWKRTELQPGMTGLWQVLGRSALSFEEMVKLDYLYVTNWRLSTDLRLLLRTLSLVLQGEKTPV